MRKVIIIIIALFCMLPIADAQNIVGKWKCSKEFLEGLNMRFGNMRGKYKFKKDSTFIIKIHGGGGAHISFFSRIPSTPRRTLYIKVKGTYSITNGTITTNVKPGDVDCNINVGFDLPPEPTAHNGGRWEVATYDMIESKYRKRENQGAFQEETIKNEYMNVWNWRNEPITVTKKTLTVGDKATFKK